MKLFIVVYSESQYEPETIVKIFDSEAKALNHIANMVNVPKLDNKGYGNDDYYDPDFLYIDDTHTLE